MIVCEPQPTRDGSRSPCWKITPRGCLGSQSIHHPRFIVERCLSLKRPWQKLTVFRAAANRSAAFQSGCLGCVGLDSPRRRAIPDPARRRETFVGAGCGRVRCGRPGLTRRSLVSTLKQSPESRRYGCDPGTSGDRAGQQQNYLWPTADEVRRLSGRTAMRDQRGERRGQGQADFPAEQPAPSPRARFPVADAYPRRALDRVRSAP